MVTLHYNLWKWNHISVQTNWYYGKVWKKEETNTHTYHPHIITEASKESKYAPQPGTLFIMVCFMGFQELSPSVMQNVLQEATSPTFSLFMTCVWSSSNSGSVEAISTTLTWEELERERKMCTLETTESWLWLQRMWKGQSGSESRACVYHHHHHHHHHYHSHSSFHRRWNGSPKSTGLTDQDYKIKPLISYITENPSAIQDFACCTDI